MSKPDSPRLLPSAKVAKRFGVSTDTARRWIRQGRFGTDYLSLTSADGKARMFVRAERVDALMREMTRIRTPEEVLAEALARPGRTRKV